MSNHTTPIPEVGTVVAGSVGLASSVIAAPSLEPLSRSSLRPRATSRTVTELTVTGTGKPLVSSSS